MKVQRAGASAAENRRGCGLPSSPKHPPLFIGSWHRERGTPGISTSQRQHGHQRRIQSRQDAVVEPVLKAGGYWLMLRPQRQGPQSRHARGDPQASIRLIF